MKKMSNEEKKLISLQAQADQLWEEVSDMSLDHIRHYHDCDDVKMFQEKIRCADYKDIEDIMQIIKLCLGQVYLIKSRKLLDAEGE